MILKWINLIKDAFLVYDDFAKNGSRISEAMVANALMLVSSALVGFGVINTGFTDAEIMAVGTGMYALVNLIIRLRSPGGKIKVRDDVATRLPPANSPTDEHSQL